MPYDDFWMNRQSSILLPESLDGQDHLFVDAFSILYKAISAHAFPGASTAITHCGRLIGLKAVGGFTYEPNSLPSKTCTIFDLASVTKVVATTTLGMILFERGLLDLDAPLAAVVPEFLPDAKVDSRRQQVTLRMLLAHSSGLPAHEKLFLLHHSREDLLRQAFATPLTDPRLRTEYSDIGFILLGVALERIAGENLDVFSQREIFSPLGMVHTSFNPPADLHPEIAPTAEDQTFRHRIIQGEVQDENASVMGGVAGHAGVFSDAGDMARFAHCMLGGGKPILRPETIALFTRREASPQGTSRALGWDAPSAPSQSGKYFSAASFGHLGYTGTSLWIDPERELSITLLTNRTWPDCSNQMIKEIRPRFHDAVVEAVSA